MAYVMTAKIIKLLINYLYFINFFCIIINFLIKIYGKLTHILENL